MHKRFVTISASSRLLLTPINNVLDLGKMDADKMDTIETCTIPKLPMIRDSILICQYFSDPNDVSLVAENDKLSDWTVQANRLRLEQILVNRLSNGIRYPEPGTSVVFSCDNVDLRECWKVRLEIIDSCCRGSHPKATANHDCYIHL
jgi:signal transduction histidine kinase